jgi:hypothetical protein
MNISSTRGSVLFIIFLVLIILISSSMVVAGWNEGQLETKITAPFKSLFSTIQNKLQPSITPGQPSPAQYTSSSEATFNKETEATAESHSVILVITPTSKVRITVAPTKGTRYIYPTTGYPTIAPGAPGSKEWNDAFWEKWQEMSKHNSQMQKQVQENQESFCENNPSLCH